MEVRAEVPHGEQSSECRPRVAASELDPTPRESRKARQEWIPVLARPSVGELLWLSEEKNVTVPLGEPPTALEVGSDRFERRRRLPLRAERVGTGAPDLGPDVIFAEYTGLADDSLVVLATKSCVLAYRGQSLGSSAYDVLPSGKD